MVGMQDALNLLAACAATTQEHLTVDGLSCVLDSLQSKLLLRDVLPGIIAKPDKFHLGARLAAVQVSVPLSSVNG